MLHTIIYTQFNLPRLLHMLMQLRIEHRGTQYWTKSQHFAEWTEWSNIKLTYIKLAFAAFSITNHTGRVKYRISWWWPSRLAIQRHWKFITANWEPIFKCASQLIKVAKFCPQAGNCLLCHFLKNGCFVIAFQKYFVKEINLCIKFKIESINYR